jgi:hypothetical protein
MSIFNRIENIYYNFKYGICNVFKWIPIVWQLRDWDGEFIYPLIYQQLKHTENYLRNYGCSVSSIKDANQIRIAKNLAKRLWDNKYTENASIPINKKYGEIKCHSEPYKYDKSGNPILYLLVFDETAKERKLRSKAYKHADYMKKQDRKILFSLMEKKINNWWD